MFVSLRVVRGPDWSSGESDGGEGHVGTVVSLEGAGSVDVIWDSGQRTTCRAGKDGRHDLRVFDSSPMGIRHKGVTCCVCGSTDIPGTRWKCTVCKDADLCGLCYSGDKHDLAHVFSRIDVPGGQGVHVKKRSACLKIRSLGLYLGARVVRGEDWKWGTQDGGSGSKGKIVACSNDEDKQRNIVRVKWDNGNSNIYRVAHEGKVDIKYIDQAPGPSYYRDHLQLLDVNRVQKANSADLALAPGCKVCIAVDNEELKRVQADKGGWSSGLGACIGKFGTLKKFPSDSVALVDFSGTQYRIAREALVKVHEHSLHDVVRILTDKKIVKQLQDGHGEWNDKMEKSLGKVGRVRRVDSDGDVVVVFGSTKWIFNPACCTPAPGERLDEVDSSGASGDIDMGGVLMEMFARMLDPRILARMAAAREGGVPGKSRTLDLFEAVVKGNAAAVKSIIQADPQKKNALIKDLTPLMIASHEGNTEVVKVLLDLGVDLEVKGKKGLTALCSAIIGKREVIAKLLIDGGANIHVTLNDGQTTLHIAVHRNLYKVVALLISKGADVNKTDSSNDTALHDAIEAKSNECVEVLLKAPGVDLLMCNRGHFNSLHLASLRGNVFAVEKILAKDISLTNVLMEGDTFSALHIAAKNDHVECVRLLLDKGKASVDTQGHKGLTPLHIAANGTNIRVVELLLDRGADVNAVDQAMDTPLHHLFIHCSKKKKEKGGLSPNEVEKYVQVAVLLLKKKARYNTKNLLGARPLQMCLSERIKAAVQSYIEKNKSSLNSESGPSAKDLMMTTAKGDNMMSTLKMALPCCKCYSSMSDVTLRPCNHKVLCSSCVLSYTKCPMCDSPITKREGEPDPAEMCKVQ